jgi:hypothetical protein
MSKHRTHCSRIYERACYLLPQTVTLRVTGNTFEVTGNTPHALPSKDDALAASGRSSLKHVRVRE